MGLQHGPVDGLVEEADAVLVPLELLPGAVPAHDDVQPGAAQGTGLGTAAPAGRRRQRRHGRLQQGCRRGKVLHGGLAAPRAAGLGVPEGPVRVEHVAGGTGDLHYTIVYYTYTNNTILIMLYIYIYILSDK